MVELAAVFRPELDCIAPVPLACGDCTRIRILTLANARAQQMKPRKKDWILAPFLLIVFAIVAWVSNLETALAAGITFGVFAIIIQEKWASRGDWRFWLVISVFALIHIIAITVIRFPQPRAGTITLTITYPFAIIDGLVMWGLINWIERRFPRAADAGPAK